MLLTVLLLPPAVATTLITFAWFSGGDRCRTTTPPPPQVVTAMPPVEVTTEPDTPLKEVADPTENLVLDEPTAEDLAIVDAPEVNDKDEELDKIRQAARDYVKAAYPDAKVEGVFLLALRPSNLYIAGVDSQFVDNKRKTVDLLVRRYVRKAGGYYWRAESLDGGQAATLKNATALP